MTALSRTEEAVEASVPDGKLKNLRHVVLDMDGTIYCGNKLFDTTIPFFEILSSLGITFSFLTNNSSKSVRDYIGKLSSMGINSGKDSLYTSTLFAAEYLKRNFPDIKKLFVLGTESMKLELCGHGFEIVFTSPDAVVAGYDTELTYDKLCKAAYWISQGALFIATHPDRFCPTNASEFMAIDCGWITEFLRQVTGKTSIVLGKPHREMLIYALKRHGFKPEEAAMAGDRYNTDVKMAIDAGALSVHINSGEPGNFPLPDITVPDLLKFGRMLEKYRVGTDAKLKKTGNRKK